MASRIDQFAAIIFVVKEDIREYVILCGVCFLKEGENTKVGSSNVSGDL